MKQRDTRILRKRKMLLILPFIVVPFITLAFWALGGGKGNINSAATGGSTGINTNLPGAVFPREKELDKLGYYEKADADSDKIKAMIRNDPFYNSTTHIDDSALTLNVNATNDFELRGEDELEGRRLRTTPYDHEIEVEANEKKIMEKLALLEKSLDDTESVDVQTPEKDFGTETSNEYQESSTDESRLQQIMQSAQTENLEGGGQLDQLSGMLDKILDIQHPERINGMQFQNGKMQKETAYAVSVRENNVHYSVLDTIESADKIASVEGNRNGFYSMEDNLNVNQYHQSIQAEVQESQTLVGGATVKLRIKTDIYINGTFIPKGQFVFGIANLAGERLKIEIRSIAYRNNIFPVTLNVYDLDGMEGIYIPGSITREATKQSADQAIQSLGINNISNSLSVQAASAGIETLKNLASKKVKLVKVTVKAGYRVLLLNPSN